mgnify:CR=1 FL=1|tara:strand:- start:12774 stop:13178 length:405 start_codon:yes stop_codon:yes gene_type:complete
MGNTTSINKLNFQALQTIINKQISEFIIISTLPEDNQNCLIVNTISPSEEYKLLNQYIKTNLSIKIVIYGENSTDNSVIDKYNQLYKLGFKNIYVYLGGLFEWLLLQDIYGDDQFITTNKIIDILKYKGKSIIK